MMNNFQAALFQANLLYGIELDQYDYEEYALIAWNKIGNHRVRLYHLEANINEKDLSVELPCNCELVEAVTGRFEDFNYTFNYRYDNSLFIEQYIESRKRRSEPLYASGKYLKYEQIGNKLYFDKNYKKVHILYYGNIVDEDGLPQLTDAEVDAIATFIAYVITYKNALQQNNSQLINLASDLRQQWAIKCDQARVPEYLNQNEMNEILDAKMSWNRKVYGKSLKPIR